MTRVACDRKARPYWHALSPEERVAIKAAIPADHYVTLVHTNATPPFHARLFADDGTERRLVLDGGKGWNVSTLLRALLGLPLYAPLVVTTDSEGYIRSIEEVEG